MPRISSTLWALRVAITKVVMGKEFHNVARRTIKRFHREPTGWNHRPPGEITRTAPRPQHGVTSGTATRASEAQAPEKQKPFGKEPAPGRTWPPSLRQSYEERE